MQHATLEQACVQGAEFQRRTILIVDDDEVTADALSHSLAKQGYATTAVDTGEAALEIARRVQPRMILLDLRLPDRDGLSICEELVDDPDTSEIPVIVISGMEQPDTLRRARAAGCRFYLRKPYDPNALLALIRQAIDESEGPDGSS